MTYSKTGAISMSLAHVQVARLESVIGEMTRDDDDVAPNESTLLAGSTEMTSPPLAPVASSG